MAKQNGPHYITGTLQKLVFYQCKGHYYVRSKSSLDRKRFKEDPAFAASRQTAAQFGVAARLASHFYRQLPKAQKQQGLIAKLTGTIQHLLQQGYTQEVIWTQLHHQYNSPPQPLATKPQRAVVKRGALSLSRWQVAPKGRLIHKKPSPGEQAPYKSRAAIGEPLFSPLRKKETKPTFSPLKAIRETG